jgi:hypothetical protein
MTTEGEAFHFSSLAVHQKNYILKQRRAVKQFRAATR